MNANASTVLEYLKRVGCWQNLLTIADYLEINGLEVLVALIELESQNQIKRAGKSVVCWKVQ